MEKIKVSKEIGLALERLFEKGLTSRLGREGYLIYNYMMNGFSIENKILKQLTLEEITKVAFEGYEVEKTPEEIILDEIKKTIFKDDLDNAFIDGIKFTLDAYGIKIKGVNC